MQVVRCFQVVLLIVSLVIARPSGEPLWPGGGSETKMFSC